MARYADQSSKTVIKEWRKQGRGLGQGAQYKPWINPRDVSSRGYSTRAPGQTTGRVHSLLSSHERHFLYLMDWSERTKDIREQFPLDLEKTLEIAQCLRVGHPTNKRSGQPFVMTTDFRVTLLNDRDEAFAIKPKKDLSTRTMEKLAIEEMYWQVQNISWKVVTEDKIPVAFARNVDWICDVGDFEDYNLGPELTAKIACFLWEDVAAGSVPLCRLTDQVDRANGYEAGTSLLVVRQMLARRLWRVDMFKPIDPTEVLYLINVEGTNTSAPRTHTKRLAAA